MDGAGEDVYADPMTRDTGYSPAPEPSMGWTQPRIRRVTAITCTRMTWARLFLVMLAADTALSPGPCSSSATGSSVYCLSNGRVSPSKHGALGARCVCPPPAGFCCSIPFPKRRSDAALAGFPFSVAAVCKMSPARSGREKKQTSLFCV